MFFGQPNAFAYAALVLFVPLTLGMGWFVAYMQTRYYQTRDEEYRKMAKFWGKLFLINAPEANVASIYLSDVDGSRMVLEYPFLTTDGKSQVPTAGELEEAIYCAVRGATPEEQEASGRCLVD